MKVPMEVVILEISPATISRNRDTTSCHGSKANISVTKGYDYRVRGGTYGN